MNPNNPNPAPSGTPTPPAQPQPGVSLEQFQQLQETVRQMSSFVEDASFIISGIYKDPDLRKAVGEKFGQPGEGNPPANPNPAPQPPANPNPAPQPPANPNPAPTFVTDARIDDVDVKTREDIIARVEAKYGYNNLQPEQRRALRRNVEKQLNVWNSSVRNAPVTQLTQLLEDAYVLQNLGKAKQEGKLEGLVEARENAMGAFPSMGNASPAPETTQLTPEQSKWTQRWGLNADKVTDRLKEFEETGVATYKPPTPAGQTPPVAPSGNPTPPAAPAPAAPAPQPQNAQ